VPIYKLYVIRRVGVKATADLSDSRGTLGKRVPFIDTNCKVLSYG